ncbi:hypothetical protein [Thermithiobacillus plumbiphilus]|uniref:Metallophosphoesterase n=1 Tax=Thermithiobacillus plumbiphilus TaxID=1729899 RepID=A0ABU9D7Q2_9PROT
MSRIFFTADSHFGHDRIIEYCNRPFASAAQMDAGLIQRWNARVGVQDTVYHLGDFTLKKPTYAQNILRQLHGTKHLIIGNHDHAADHTLWASAALAADLTVNGRRLYLCHYPLREWPGMWRGALHLYGHVHGSYLPLPGSMDVGADVWGGWPVTLEEILPTITPYDADQARQQQTRLQLQPW